MKAAAVVFDPYPGIWPVAPSRSLGVGRCFSGWSASAREADKRKENVQNATSAYIKDLKTWGMPPKRAEDVVHKDLWALAHQSISEV